MESRDISAPAFHMLLINFFFCSPLAEALEHERYVTGLIHEIYDAAYGVKDFRTMQFLDWFVKEQGEEEMNAEGLVKKFELRALKDDGRLIDGLQYDLLAIVL